METARLEQALISIIVRGSERGPRAIDREEAAEVLEALVASNRAPAWQAVKAAREQLQQAIEVLRQQRRRDEFHAYQQHDGEPEGCEACARQEIAQEGTRRVAARSAARRATATRAMTERHRRY